MSKKSKDPVLKTKRLILTPMPEAEVEKLAAGTDELAAAYAEMLAGARQHPEARIWYLPWSITLRKEGTLLGDIGFKGPVTDNAVEIGYGLDEAYWGQGYATEAAGAMKDYAFSRTGCFYVEAETEPSNAASQRVLEKLGFVPDGTGAEGPRFVLEAPIPNWIAIYMCFGLSIGMSIGSSTGNISIGMSLGIAIGLAIGAALNSSEKKRREEVRAARAARKEKEASPDAE